VRSKGGFLRGVAQKGAGSETGLDLRVRGSVGPFRASYASYAGASVGGGAGDLVLHTQSIFQISIYLFIYTQVRHTVGPWRHPAPGHTYAQEARKAQEDDRCESLRRSEYLACVARPCVKGAQEVRTIPSMPEVAPADDNRKRTTAEQQETMTP
jgi:hypothetical protein